MNNVFVAVVFLDIKQRPSGLRRPTVRPMGAHRSLHRAQKWCEMEVRNSGSPNPPVSCGVIEFGVDTVHRVLHQLQPDGSWSVLD